jgi:hypothetical protein
MAKIMVTGYYDPSSYDTFLPTSISPDKPKYPNYIKKVMNLMTGTGDFKIYALYEVPDDKIYEALKYLNKHYFFYAANMPGYEFNIELVGPIEDAMEMLK